MYIALATNNKEPSLEDIGVDPKIVVILVLITPVVTKEWERFF
jgi:hypothetical protein